MVYPVLALATMLYLLLSAYMDFKERAVYSFPGIMLIITWYAAVFFNLKYDWKFVTLYALTNIVLWFFFNRYHIWGAGDSDIFLLMSAIIIAIMPESAMYMLLVYECNSLISVLLIAIGCGVVEAAIKGTSLNLKSGLAVVPGFAAVIGLLLCKGFMGGIV